MQIAQHRVIPQTVPYSVQRNWKQQVLRRNNRMWKMATWDFALIMTFERKWKTQSLKNDYARKRSTELSCKSTIAANVDLTKSLLDNSLKNNHIIVDKIYYLRSLFVFFYEFHFSNLFLNGRKPAQKQKLGDAATRQLAQLRLEWISQSKGTIVRTLGFVIDRLNTSASLYRIAPCLTLSD